MKTHKNNTKSSALYCVTKPFDLQTPSVIMLLTSPKPRLQLFEKRLMRTYFTHCSSTLFSCSDLVRSLKDLIVTIMNVFFLLNFFKIQDSIVLTF